jgi:hypothetical protein
VIEAALSFIETVQSIIIHNHKTEAAHANHKSVGIGCLFSPALLAGFFSPFPNASACSGRSGQAERIER